eukprot:CAMPEP_0119034132 /NCGR_PEP_ID=MMETSP1177-20130426/1164_1 /TAXON_ID=2985 /ORGANISM="Ochromonas sp, Strain CCMP1899" /LENGTH=304 /DNA_ID=CAMNT_0006991375 /DNA_START=99 /DNA_END=1010 /DNA_ORIENTATION=+
MAETDDGDIDNGKINRSDIKETTSDDDNDVWGSSNVVMQGLTELSPIEVNPFSGNFADELFNFTDESTNLESRDERSANTTTSSVLTENSVHSGMTLPFPFHNRPLLPHVDEFIQKDKLHYNHLRLLNMYERKSRLMNPHEPCIKKPIDDDVKRKEDKDNKSRLDSLSRRSYDTIEAFAMDDESFLDDDDLSNTQIKEFVKYIISVTEGDEPHTESRIGVTFKNMKTALRMHTRNTSKFDDGRDYLQELLMASFNDLLCRSDINYLEWFNMNSIGLEDFDRRMNALLFNKSIRKMCEEHYLPGW